MDQRVESFLGDVLALAGEEPDAVPEGVRRALAKCEAIFRLQEPKKRMRDQAMPRHARNNALPLPELRRRVHACRAEAGPPPDHQIECRRCGAPLHGREGKFILKYFLIGRGRTQAEAARAG